MRIFSGIRPSGEKTLGNYAGGYRQYAETQEQGEAVFCIVDLHSISDRVPARRAARARRSTGAAMLVRNGHRPGTVDRVRAESRQRTR